MLTLVKLQFFIELAISSCFPSRTEIHTNNVNIREVKWTK